MLVMLKNSTTNRLAFGGIAVGAFLSASVVVLLPELLDVLEVGGQLAVGGDYGTMNGRHKVVLVQGFLGVRADDVDGIGEEHVAEKVGGLAGQLRWHVVDRADQNTRALERLRVLVAIRVVQTERRVYGCALVHEPLN